MSNRYVVSVTLRTGEEPIEVVYCSSPHEAITLAMDRWGEVSVGGRIEGMESDGEE